MRTQKGESISWHLAEELGLDLKLPSEWFSPEITAPAIKKSCSKSSFYDKHELVNAQQVRHVLDRLSRGFELDSTLYKIGITTS